MSRPTTTEALGDLLAEDRVWRLRELSDLKAAIRRSDAIGKPVLLRSLVTVAYAHWEGYVRLAARTYLEHVSLRRLPYSDLAPQFRKNLFLPKLSSFASTNKSYLERCRLMDEILEAGSLRFSKIDASIVSTRSNLSSAVMSDICLVCGVDPSPFKSEATFIDIALLGRRNQIAHGESSFIGEDAVDNIVEMTVTLMRTFADALENAAVSGSYRAVMPAERDTSTV